MRYEKYNLIIMNFELSLDCLLNRKDFVEIGVPLHAEADLFARYRLSQIVIS